jgi:hypothetical protein
VRISATRKRSRLGAQDIAAHAHLLAFPGRLRTACFSVLGAGTAVALLMLAMFANLGLHILPLPPLPLPGGPTRAIGQAEALARTGPAGAAGSGLVGVSSGAAAGAPPALAATYVPPTFVVPTTGPSQGPTDSPAGNTTSVAIGTASPTSPVRPDSSHEHQAPSATAAPETEVPTSTSPAAPIAEPVASTGSETTEFVSSPPTTGAASEGTTTGGSASGGRPVTSRGPGAGSEEEAESEETDSEEEAESEEADRVESPPTGEVAPDTEAEASPPESEPADAGVESEAETEVETEAPAAVEPEAETEVPAAVEPEAETEAPAAVEPELPVAEETPTAATEPTEEAPATE